MRANDWIIPDDSEPAEHLPAAQHYGSHWRPQQILEQPWPQGHDITREPQANWSFDWSVPTKPEPAATHRERLARLLERVAARIRS